VDFAEIEALQRGEQWPKMAHILARSAISLEAAGADFIVLCTNTMHKVAADIESAVRIPLLHIADATAKAVSARGLKKIGLLGTRFTMEEDFYKGRLSREHGIDVHVPDGPDREAVHRVIFQELVVGRIESSSRQKLAAIIEGLARSGAEGVILGCTELGLLVKEKDSPLPLFDTTLIHAQAAVDFALQS
jgi:aspartate racemase